MAVQLGGVCFLSHSLVQGIHNAFVIPHCLGNLSQGIKGGRSASYQVCYFCVRIIVCVAISGIDQLPNALSFGSEAVLQHGFLGCRPFCLALDISRKLILGRRCPFCFGGYAVGIAFLRRLGPVHLILQILPEYHCSQLQFNKILVNDFYIIVIRLFRIFHFYTSLRASAHLIINI